MKSYSYQMIVTFLLSVLLFSFVTSFRAYSAHDDTSNKPQEEEELECTENEELICYD